MSEVAWRSVGAVLLFSVPALAEPPPPRAPADVRVAAAPGDESPRLPVTPRFARAVVAAALRAARYSEQRSALASMAARTRSSAILPEVWLRSARTTDQSLRLAPTTDDPGHYSEIGGAGLWLEARLVWHLDRLLFDSDEVAVQRLKNEHATVAARLVGRVLGELFAWQRAVLRAGDDRASPEDREAASVRRLEAEITLDVLTDGFFTAEIEKRARP
jgi:hypothetical protein